MLCSQTANMLFEMGDGSVSTVAGGGEGMGAIEQTLDALDDRLGGACQVVAICGRNKALIERLQNRWESQTFQEKVDFESVVIQWLLPGNHSQGSGLVALCIPEDGCAVQRVSWRVESEAVWLCQQHGRVDDSM